MHPDRFDEEEDRTAPTFLSNSRGIDANDNPDLDVSEDELNALKDEVDILNDGSFKDAADNMLLQKAPQAVLSLSKLAQSATSETVRLQASKYIVERVLGPLSKIEPDRDPTTDPIYKLLHRAGMLADD